MSEIATNAASKLLNARPNQQARWMGILVFFLGILKLFGIENLLGVEVLPHLDYGVDVSLGISLVAIAIGGGMFIYGARMERERLREMTKQNMSCRKRNDRTLTDQEMLLLEYARDNEPIHARDIAAYWRELEFEGTKKDLQERLGMVRLRNMVDIGHIKAEGDLYTIRDHSVFGDETRMST